MSGWLDFAGAANRSIAETAGAPVDLTNWLLAKAGMGAQKPVFGSNWLKDQMHSAGMATDGQGLPAVAGGLAGSLAIPGAPLLNALDISSAILRSRSPTEGATMAVGALLGPMFGGAKKARIHAVDDAAGDLNLLAKRAYESGEVPDGWYVHGRYGRQDLDTDNVLQLTKDWNIANQYSKNGSRWMIRAKQGADVLDLSDESTADMNSVVSKAVKDFESGNLPFLDDIENALGREANAEDVARAVRSSFAPQKIVDSAEAYDNSSWLDWLTEQFDSPAIVKTPDGAIAINRNGLDTVKVP